MSLVKSLMTRLSPHFLLLDFAYDRDIYTMKADKLLRGFGDEQREMGEKLCDELIEPMMQVYGPVSIAAGFAPTTGHTAMHSWTFEGGAAADMVFHDWVNREHPPIALCDDLDLQHPEIAFDRLITYATSELICVGTSMAPRYAIHENIYLREEERTDKAHLFSSWGYSREKRKRWPSRSRGYRENWRRPKNVPGPHTGRAIRAQHVRVGRYFTMLDFCRNPYALQARRLHVPVINSDEDFGRATPAVERMRCVAEVLSSIVATNGYLSIVRAYEPAGFSTDLSAPLHDWANSEVVRVVFAVSPDRFNTAIVDQLQAHPAVKGVRTQDIPGSTLVSVVIETYEVEEVWASHL